MKHCLNCNALFVPRSTRQLYCSESCGRMYRRHYKGKIKYPSVTFSCAKCGKEVTTKEGSCDRRSRFCSKICEKRYWKHPKKTGSQTSASSNFEYDSLVDIGGIILWA